MIWLGSKRGYLTDWFTQKWVQVCGRKVSLLEFPWLDGPVGSPLGIGTEFFKRLAADRGWTVSDSTAPRGLLRSVMDLEGPHCQPGTLQEGVSDFYEKTSDYSLDAWGEWSGVFRPFGRLVALLFSRRLQQLNVPISALDTSRGISSQVLHLVDPDSGDVKLTAWVRELLGSNDVLYAGSYSLCQVPGFDGTCIKVVFPLPNGNAMVIMRPENHPDGSLTVTSSGKRFGDPGFYFTVHGANGGVQARYLRTFKESIHVFQGAKDVRADHEISLWGARFLRLHYRMRPDVQSNQPMQSDGASPRR